MRRWTRRQFLGFGIAAATAGGTVASPDAARASMLSGNAPAGPLLSGSTGSSPASGVPTGFFDSSQRATLGAAVSRMIPASGPGDWSAADIGVVDYIDNLLAGFDRDASTGGIYPSGPYRNSSSEGPGFFTYQELSRVKSTGWRAQVEGWRSLYTSGLVALDQAAGGNFASAIEVEQDLILEQLDLSGSSFFSALFDHTMEGAYSHPVYGGNDTYAAWQWLGFGGDVHGVRFPTTGSHGSWNVYGGYAPEEMLAPGGPANETPVATPDPPTKW